MNDNCPDDFCPLCKSETDYETCYCCTLCWRLVCEKCVFLFNKNTLFTICNDDKCITTYNILHILFIKDIAIKIASFTPLT